MFAVTFDYVSICELLCRWSRHSGIVTTVVGVWSGGGLYCGKSVETVLTSVVSCVFGMG